MELPFVSRKKYNELVYKLECLLCHATGGRYSKAGYSLEDMCRMVDEHIDRCIDELPRADVVEVVRCKDCKWCEDLLMSGLYCNHPDNRNPINCLPTDFCNCGERSEE
jgi:hypothetical protein